MDRSLVRQIERELKENGFYFDFVDDIDEGDLRNKPDELQKTLRDRLLRQCSGLLLLIGKNTHSPSNWLKYELKYAESNQWPVAGLNLPNRTGSAPKEITNYKHYHECKYEYKNSNLRQIISFLNKTLS